MIPNKAESLALVIDDNEVFRTRLCRALEDRGWRSSAAEDGPTAIALAKQLAPDLAIVDLRLPGMGGLDIVKEIRQLDETTCIIVLTGYGSIATAP
jgi:two-component system response regulator RegA